MKDKLTTCFLTLIMSIMLIMGGVTFNNTKAFATIDGGDLVINNVSFLNSTQSSYLLIDTNSSFNVNDTDNQIDRIKYFSYIRAKANVEIRVCSFLCKNIGLGIYVNGEMTQTAEKGDTLIIRAGLKTLLDETLKQTVIYIYNGYTWNFASILSSGYEFKAISGACLNLDSLNDDNPEAVSMAFSSSIPTDNYTIGNMEVKACLIDSQKIISVENMAYGIYGEENSMVSGDKTVFRFSFSIPQNNYKTVYRCIFMLYIYGNDNTCKIVLADYSNIETDRSVYMIAEKILADPNNGLSEVDLEKLEEIINHKVEHEESNNRQEEIDSAIQDIKDYGQALLENSEIRKILSVLGGLFFIVLFCSILSTIFSTKKRK